MPKNVFNRVEKKYLLSERQYQALIGEIRANMDSDAYGNYTIRNIYFDTDTNELIRTSIEAPCYKEKFRVRCYGAPDDNTPLYLEIKKKYQGVVNKRRIAMTRQEAEAYLLHGEKPAEESQIFREIDYFIHHYGVRPALYLAYDRIAFFGREDPEFRVTFDTNIRSRRTNLTLESDEDTTVLLPPDTHLMEVKITNAMPLWFVAILSRYEIRNLSFSKYGSIYQKELQTKRSISC